VPRSMIPVVLGCLVALFVAAPGASAQSTNDVVRDCLDDSKLDRDYTPSQIRRARNNLPSDVDEYSDCRDVLNRALTSANRHNDNDNDGGNQSNSSGSNKGSNNDNNDSGSSNRDEGSSEDDGPLTPQDDAERKALEQAQSNTPVQVGDQKVSPGTSSFATQAARNGVPTPLIIVLALLGLAATAAGVPVARRQVAALGPAVMRLLRRR
jgi:hypothetical protein